MRKQRTVVNRREGAIFFCLLYEEILTISYRIVCPYFLLYEKTFSPHSYQIIAVMVVFWQCKFWKVKFGGQVYWCHFVEAFLLINSDMYNNLWNLLRAWEWMMMFEDSEQMICGPQFGYGKQSGSKKPVSPLLQLWHMISKLPHFFYHLSENFTIVCSLLWNQDYVRWAR